MAKFRLTLVLGLLFFSMIISIKAASTRQSYEDLQDYLQLVKQHTHVSLLPLPDLKLAPLPAFTPLLSSSLFDREMLVDHAQPPGLATNMLQTQAIHLHYADVTQLAAFLQKENLGLLSAEGKLTADDKSNVLWVRDHPAQINQLVNMISHYDQPTAQVYIRAKIINIDKEYLRSLGVAFSSDKETSTQQGGIEDLSIPIAKLGNDVLLEATLDALEKNGHARIISNPELITLNRQPATIESGEDVPYQQSTYSGGTSVVFKKAVLRLEVTPEIMPHSQVLLHLKINQDQVSALSVNGVPAISTQEITTQVYMKDKSTVVLGGISEQTSSQQRSGIPGLGHIPIVGGLFRHLDNVDDRKQLLIFVTPVIIHT